MMAPLATAQTETPAFSVHRNSENGWWMSTVNDCGTVHGDPHETGKSLSSGWLGSEEGLLQAAAWLVGEDGSDLLVTLPALAADRSSWSRALYAAVDEFAIVGAARNAEDQTVPVFWGLDAENPANASLPTILPTLPGGSGEALAITATPAGQPMMATGQSRYRDDADIQKAVVWARGVSGEWTITTLPSYAAGLSSSGHAIGMAPDNTIWCTGWAQTAEGDTIPQAWSSTDWGVSWLRTPLPLAPGGEQGMALAFGFQAGFRFAAGWCRAAEAERIPILWVSPDAGQSWLHEVLPPLPGFSAGLARGLVNAGGSTKVVGRSYAGPEAGTATLWICQPQDTTRVHDLNDLVVSASPLALGSANEVAYDPLGGHLAVVGSGRESTAKRSAVGPHAYTMFQVNASGAGRPVAEDWFPAMMVAPNPFAGQTSISFRLGSPEAARLTVYDVAGRRITTLAGGILDSGGHMITWDGRDQGGRPVAQGIYLLRLEARGAMRTHKLILIR